MERKGRRSERDAIADIRLGNVTVLSGVRIGFWESAAPDGNGEWGGSLPGQLVLSAILDIRETYQLVLADGRQGPIAVSMLISIWPHVCTFRGLGPFEQPVQQSPHA